MLKHFSGKTCTLAIAGIAVVAVLVAVVICSLVLRVGVGEARETALAAAGGGEVVGQEIDREGLWNEYSFDVLNGDTWYEVEVNAFGWVTGLESSRGGYGNGGHWD